MLEYEEYIKIFFGVLAIMGPFSALPIFVTLTAGKSKQEKNTLALQSSLYALLIACSSLFI